MKRVLKKQNEKKASCSEFYRILLKVNNFNEVKIKTIFLAILTLGFIFTSCEDDDLHLVPSDKITTEEISVSAFNKLDVSNMFQVSVTFSDEEESVLVESNENLHAVIELTQQGDKLYIDLSDNTTISGSPILKVYIKTATLNEVEAEGAAVVTFHNKLIASSLELELEGASIFNGMLELDELYVDILGASVLNLTGNSNVFDIDAEGASVVTGFGFSTNDLISNLNGASNISLTVNETLNVTASGASNVYYKGSVVIESQNLSDTSEITKVD